MMPLQVYDQLVTEFRWKSFAILYENTDSLVRMRLLLKRWDPLGNSAFVYHLGDGPNYRYTLQKRLISQSKVFQSHGYKKKKKNISWLIFTMIVHFELPRMLINSLQ